MNRVAQNLKAAKALIADPKSWIQGDYAANAEGSADLMGDEPSAVCFCSLGALQRIGNTMFEEDLPEIEFLDQALATLGTEFKSVAGYNDNSTHAEVMVLWDKAIELAEAVN